MISVNRDLVVFLVVSLIILLTVCIFCFLYISLNCKSKKKYLTRVDCIQKELTRCIAREQRMMIKYNSLTDTLTAESQKLEEMKKKNTKLTEENIWLKHFIYKNISSCYKRNGDENV